MKLKASALSLLVSIIGIALLAAPATTQTKTRPPATYPALPSEIPAKFTPKTGTFDYSRRKVMIPMRDGVKLHTVLLIPKGAKGAPILLTRTPYSAGRLTSHADSAHLGPVLNGYDNALEVILEGGYIRVVQDVRGKHGSEGDYIVNRPLRGPQNPTPVDHATDTWDTIDWLAKNVPQSNGKVGILGISYDGFLPLMALVNPHPALKVSVPMNPMVDGWVGDDWFHYGAFRQVNVSWIYNQVATRKGDAKWWRSHNDEYDMFMQAASAGELGRRRGLDQLGFWNKLVEHPAYDDFWRNQAVDKLLAAQPLKTPVMLVHSLWDQEDIYGAPAVYKALEPKDTANDKVFLVLGPWHHGQMIGNGSSLGAVKFGSDTALYFRKKILGPFLAQYLKDGAPKADIAPVTAFETGMNEWRRYSAWPPKAEGDRAGKMTPLYLRAGLKLSYEAPKPGDAAFEEYISDPAKPVPFSRRPIKPMGYEEGNPWPQWLVDDQREASGRPDVVTFISDTLTAPMKISGEPIANLVASTSGTDADWVVKLIDVYPDEVGGDAVMGGYQLMISSDIFRGRYRESFTKAKPIAPDTPLLYRFALPTANHVFLTGHRIMVQIQSSWFPLYDRNPQSFVSNIFWAKPGEYCKATQRVYHAPKESSFIELPLAGLLASARSPATVETQYRIQTLAGNGRAGDIPESGGKAAEIALDLPFGVENGPDRALYITTVGSHRVLRLDHQGGRVTSVAGNGRKGYSGDGGPATKAMLNEPYEVRFDSRGNMLILEMKNHAIRRVDARSGTITTLAGDGVAGDRGDGGPARQARFRFPHSITLDDKDNLYVSDLGNHRVRRIDATSGRIESIVGNGKGELPQEGGNARDEPFLTPQGLAVRGETLWIASVSGHSLWRLHLKRGTIHRVAGTGTKGHTGDCGDPLMATFDGPRGMTLSPAGILYVPEGENNVLRAVDTRKRSIRTLAGVGPKQHRYGGDGIPATMAPIWQPHGVCLGGEGTLIISDTINHRVRLLVPIGGKARSSSE